MKEALLIRAAEALEADAANPTGIKFDLGTWASPDTAVLDPSLWKPSPRSDSCFLWKDDADGKVPASCGTMACAMGLFAIAGTFKDEGLGYSIDEGRLEPVYRGENGFYAASYLFGISYRDAQYLFDPDYYDGAQEGKAGELNVAERVRRFAAGDIDSDYHPDSRGSVD